MTATHSPCSQTHPSKFSPYSLASTLMPPPTKKALTLHKEKTHKVGSFQLLYLFREPQIHGFCAAVQLCLYRKLEKKIAPTWCMGNFHPLNNPLLAPFSCSFQPPVWISTAAKSAAKSVTTWGLKWPMLSTDRTNVPGRKLPWVFVQMIFCSCLWGLFVTTSFRFGCEN